MPEFIRVNKVNKSKNRINFVIGSVFHAFTIIDENFYKTNSSNHLYLKCKCRCERICFERADYIRKSKRQSCIKCTMELRGRKFSDFGNITAEMLIKIKKRAIEKKLEWNLTIEYLDKLFRKQKNKCALSNIKLCISKNHIEHTASLDRIDSLKGYIKGNVQWVHKRVNIMKGNMTQTDFIHICKLISKLKIEDNFEPSLLNKHAFNAKKM